MGSHRKFAQPIWLAEIAFEKWLRDAGYAESVQIEKSRVVYNFINAFPAKRKPEDFCITDVQDWAIVRRREITANGLDKELRILKGFFEFLQSYHGFRGPNPVHVGAQVRTKPAKPSISLAELRRLVAVAIQPVDRRMILLCLQSASLREVCDQIGRCNSTLTARFHHLRELAQIPPSIKLRNLRRAYLSLAQRLGERAVLALILEDRAQTELPPDGVAAVRAMEPLRVVAPLAN